MKTLEISYKNKKIKIPVKKVSGLKRFSGLMFRSKETANLLFEFRKPSREPIHSFFVFFPFIALWLDGENKAIESKIVNPFTSYVKPKRKFSSLIELPLNDNNKKIQEILVGKERFK